MSDSLGQRLKREREARFLTLEKAAADTRIRIIFLKALEADDYSVMPSAAQGRGFLRNYAAYLNLNIDEIIAEFHRNAPAVEEVSGPLPSVNLVETELPPLVAEASEEQTLSWVGRLRHGLAAMVGLKPGREIEPQDSGQVPADVDIPAFESQPALQVEADAQAEQESQMVQDDQGPPVRHVQFFQAIRNLFKPRETPSMPEAPAEVEPVQIPAFIPRQPADVIFAEIGAQLRQRRELISLTCEEVERHTRLRAVFVKALEEGRLDKLPSPVQTRGMLANYATFLDLDTDAILLRFADGLQARRHEKYAETPREKIQSQVVTSIPFWRSFIAGDLIFGVLMITVLLGLAILGVVSLMDAKNQEKVSLTPPSIAQGLAQSTLPTPSMAATPTLADKNAIPLPTIEITGQPALTANVVVEVFALERTFLRVTQDGKSVFEGRMAPGEVKIFGADEQVTVLTGNAAAVRVSYNGRDLGLMGAEGEVANRVYLVTGVATPTATISPTPTNTLPPSATPNVTSTPLPTPTALPGG